METRRDFIKKAILLSGAVGFAGTIPESIQRAFAIDPEPGSTYLDAEHIVILMQENRSFDHSFGTLQGVRGFNDPRAVVLPDGNLVWLQTNAKGETYAPFRLDIKDTRATWMGSLPHVRSSQVDAWNKGHYDQWLEAKRSRFAEYANLPMTLGHYTREDIPFYYAMADAFTICDQYFSGAMTSTFPNRLIFWTGTIREEQNGKAKANIRNEDLTLGNCHWKTFPECLQQSGISWKFYQNDVSAFGSLGGSLAKEDACLATEEDAWLGNLDCNPLEFFAQYNIKLSPQYLSNLPERVDLLSKELLEWERDANIASLAPAEREKLRIEMAYKKKRLDALRQDRKKGNDAFRKLSQTAKMLHQRAFTTNSADPKYHELVSLNYQDGTTDRQVNVPKGDVLHQFRDDVQNGRLPTVSWLMSPLNFSDHPTSPWYGAWYVSEVMDILTQNPEVWKKTIFILAYDENDGYFDHVPPFVAPDPNRKETGRTSPALNTSVEYVYREQELRQGVSEQEAREGPVGLGYRVPMVLASPWSRGGWVNSQLFDHTSTIQFLEIFLSEKFGRPVRDNNISQWRRAISGDLTTSFREYRGEKLSPLPFLDRNPLVISIQQAQFKKVPSDFKKLNATEIASVNQKPLTSPLLSHQEGGIRRSCALPYQLYAEGALSEDKRSFEINFRAETTVFGKWSKGSPFNVYARRTIRPAEESKGEVAKLETTHSASYTVGAGDTIQEFWPLDAFMDRQYHLCVYGPNGFFREYIGDKDDPALRINCEYQIGGAKSKRLTGNVAISILNMNGKESYTLEIIDNAYTAKPISKVIEPMSFTSVPVIIPLDLKKSFGWYDFSIKVIEFSRFKKRYAGRVETGQSSFSDPLMGAVFV